MRTERAAFSVALPASGRECLIRDTSGGLQRLCLWAVNTKVSLQLLRPSTVSLQAPTLDWVLGTLMATQLRPLRGSQSRREADK